jgi:hypothetical protein
MAARHMDFLYANEVLIRSEETYQALSANPSFAEVASAEPFHVFKLKSFNSHLVDLTDRPLHWLPKKDWMEASFQWFRSSQRFGSELPVFQDGTTPQITTPADSAKIQNIQLARHRLSWHTDAVGAAHLVRMAWHPRWQLATKGHLYLAGPGFMLVVPEEADVVLEYGHTPVGLAGMLATALAVLSLLFLMLRDWRQKCADEHPRHDGLHPWPRHWLAGLWPMLLIALALWLHLHNPERLYTQAWELMRTNHLSEAADEFDQAFAARKSDAKKEEALFWSAKSHEQAGLRDEALLRYGQLTTSYHGFWLAESLYAQWRLAQTFGLTAQAELARNRLLLEFPDNPWTQRLTKP